MPESDVTISAAVVLDPDSTEQFLSDVRALQQKFEQQSAAGTSSGNSGGSIGISVKVSNWDAFVADLDQRMATLSQRYSIPIGGGGFGGGMMAGTAPTTGGAAVPVGAPMGMPMAPMGMPMAPMMGGTAPTTGGAIPVTPTTVAAAVGAGAGAGAVGGMDDSGGGGGGGGGFFGMPRLAGLGGFARMFAGYRMAFTAAHAGLAYQREQDEMSLAGNDPMKQYQASMGAVNSIENSGMIGLAISEGMRLLGYDHTQSDSQVASAIAQENSAQRILDLQQRTRNQTAMTQASGMRGLARENELSRIHHDEEIQRIYKEREKEKEELSSNENTENVAARKYTATSEDEALALRRVPERWSGGGPWAPSFDSNASRRQEELERIVQAKITAAENDIHKKYDSSSAGARGLTQKMNDEFERQKTAADRAMEFANREASRQVTNETSVLAARNANDENLAGARELINKIQSNITPGGTVPNDVANLGRQQIVEYGRMHGLFGAGGALLRKQWADLYRGGESGQMSPAETGVIGPHPDAEGMSHGWYDQFHRWHENRQGSWESNNQGRSWHHPSQHRTPEELRRLQWAHKPVGGKLGELMYGGDDDDVFPMRKSGGRHFTWPHRGDFQDDSYFWGDGAPHDSERALSYHFARSLEGSHKAYGFRDMDEIRRASKYLDQTRWIQAGAPGEHVHDIGEQSLSERYAHAMEGEHGKYGFRDMNEVRRMSHYADIQRAKDHLEKRTQDFLEGEHGETWRAWRTAHPSHHVLSNAEQHDRNIRNHGPMSQLSHAMEGLGGIFGFVASSMMHNAGAEKLNSAHGKVSAGESSNSAQKLSGATDKFEKAAKQIYDAVTNAPNLVVANLYS